ncbi:ABC-2 type transport system ATP-binding protein [Arthrobacter sp. CAN_A6]|uniref:ABC transporter ATP-binding protein n=1 Tax=Arthrobacter sp. CAN_A6 TaxID=2787721 RepID=UPI0018C97B15
MRTASPQINTTPEVLASARNVTKSFNGTKALDGVFFDISAGEAVGLLGPNGAGKSTLINLLSGLRRPDSGTVKLFGREPREPGSRLRLGTTPQATSVPPTLKVRETVEFVAAHYADPIPALELLEDFGLTKLAGKQCGGLSGGQQRRLLVALALVGRPDLVLLDEPTTGLDIDARATLWRRLRQYRATGGTLLITSHYLEEIQALAGRVVVMDSGSVIADGTVDEIRHRVSLSRVSFRSLVPTSSFTALQNTAGVETNDDGRLTLITRDADSTVRQLVSENIQFADLEVHRATLEEAFRSLTEPTQQRAGAEPGKALS